MNEQISPIAIFLKKPLSKKLLLMRIFFLLSVTGLANLLLPFKVYARFLGKINSESTQNSDNVDWEYVERIAHSIRNISKVSPFEFKCLVQATVGKIFIARKNMDGTIYFGVKKDETKNLKAHAWLRVGPKIVLGGEIADQYNVVSTFS